jgi:hypothetical protein
MRGFIRYHMYVVKSAQKSDILTWWKGTCYGSKLFNVVINILTLPPTTAATERIF